MTRYAVRPRQFESHEAALYYAAFVRMNRKIKCRVKQVPSSIWGHVWDVRPL